MIEIQKSGEGSSDTLLLTFKEASNTLRCSAGMVRKLARTGRLKAVHLGRTVRITHESILSLCSGRSMEVKNV